MGTNDDPLIESDNTYFMGNQKANYIIHSNNKENHKIDNNFQNPNKNENKKFFNIRQIDMINRGIGEHVQYSPIGRISKKKENTNSINHQNEHQFLNNSRHSFDDKYLSLEENKSNAVKSIKISKEDPILIQEPPKDSYKVA